MYTVMCSVDTRSGISTGIKNLNVEFIENETMEALRIPEYFLLPGEVISSGIQQIIYIK
ncbi:hypothetical protein [Acidiplasma sp.]|uniref:hypothetical protein n=1 Tax=Acidiplasma sp. TaxID=1872114 RepID=UPI00258972B5|nr:hypothetical protein [Acidiplasma sp.]